MRSLLVLSACAAALALAAGGKSGEATAASAAKPSHANVDEVRLMASAAGQNAGQWMSQGRDHNEQRFSPLTTINDKNVGQLGLAWFGDFDTRRGQESTNESWDFDGTQQITLADVEINGAKHHVAMQANKNGMFYVVDTKTGRLLSGKGFVPNINWHFGLDPETGKPKVNPESIYTEDKGLRRDSGVGRCA